MFYKNHIATEVPPHTCYCTAMDDLFNLKHRLQIVIASMSYPNIYLTFTRVH